MDHFAPMVSLMATSVNCYRSLCAPGDGEVGGGLLCSLQNQASSPAPSLSPHCSACPDASLCPSGSALPHLNFILPSNLLIAK